MIRRLSMAAFAVLLLAAVVFVILSALSLPPVVASHFVAGGAANGFMPRGAYLAFMLALTVGVPLLMAGLASVVRAVPARHVNLPHRDYWLAPERRAETLAYLQAHGRVLAVLVLGFLCYVHWMVVAANRHQPPVLAERPFLAGLVVFVAALVVWIGILLAHFGRRP